MKTPDDEQRRDEQLVALARGDGPEAREALARLLGHWKGRVYAWCRRWTRDHERALDVSQEVLMNVYRSFASYESRAPFGAWVYTITRNACIRATRRPSLVRDDDVEPDALTDTASDPAFEFESREGEARLLARIREHLEPDEQRALWLRCVECVPVETITEELGLTHASGARAVLQNARRKLKAALERDSRRAEREER